MALYYQNFYILVVLYLFCIQVERPCFPVHVVKDSAQVLEQRVEEKQGAGRVSCLQVQSQALPACPRPAQGVPSSCSPRVSTGAR